MSLSLDHGDLQMANMAVIFQWLILNGVTLGIRIGELRQELYYMYYNLGNPQTEYGHQWENLICKWLKWEIA